MDPKITIDLGERAEIKFDRGPTEQEIEVAKEDGKDLDPRPALIIGGIRIVCHRGTIAALRASLNHPNNR